MVDSSHIKGGIIIFTQSSHRAGLRKTLNKFIVNLSICRRSPTKITRTPMSLQMGVYYAMPVSDAVESYPRVPPDAGFATLVCTRRKQGKRR